jgi:hypothetical protein
MGLKVHAFFTLVLGGVEWSASRVGRFVLASRALDCRIGPGVGLDVLMNGKAVL